MVCSRSGRGESGGGAEPGGPAAARVPLQVDGVARVREQVHGRPAHRRPAVPDPAPRLAAPVQRRAALGLQHRPQPQATQG